MQQYVSLTIDGATIRAPKGISVLDAAIQFGICIPHLCHMPLLEDIGACRICIVEHVKDGKAKVTTSCTLGVQEGMVIQAHSEKILRLRRNIAELLVAQAPNSRAIQDLAVRCGVKEVRYPFRNDDCVLCGRCVRYCGKMANANSLGFVGRGRDRRVTHALDMRDLCKQCGFCTLNCPMANAPCNGVMKPGEERLCGNCEAQLAITKGIEDTCVWCDLGKGFQCSRHMGQNLF
ncbi:MAG: 2Fe-2S iron-sulfur cluster-binding protein [Syntrophobacteraceae bacterium]|jgi:NADH dehydrogenase/NADH:ubiquinone oxidoreductase subunit G|nr:2Fe-2S iron-sulfur cluster-binding protein [Syntrophobacteraceae bacterium]